MRAQAFAANFRFSLQVGQREEANVLNFTKLFWGLSAREVIIFVKYHDLEKLKNGRDLSLLAEARNAYTIQKQIACDWHERGQIARVGLGTKIIAIHSRKKDTNVWCSYYVDWSQFTMRFFVPCHPCLLKSRSPSFVLLFCTIRVAFKYEGAEWNR